MEVCISPRKLVALTRSATSVLTTLEAVPLGDNKVKGGTEAGPSLSLVATSCRLSMKEVDHEMAV